MNSIDILIYLHKNRIYIFQLIYLKKSTYRKDGVFKTEVADAKTQRAARTNTKFFIQKNDFSFVFMFFVFIIYCSFDFPQQCFFHITNQPSFIINTN